MTKYAISFCEGNFRHWIFTNKEETAKFLFQTLAIKDIEIYDNENKIFVIFD